MDLLYILYYIALFTIPIVLFLIISKKPTENEEAWYYGIKYLLATPVVKKFKSSAKLPLSYLETVADKPITSNHPSCDTYTFKGLDHDGNSISLSFEAQSTHKAEINLILQMDGVTWTLPEQKSVVQAQNGAWSCRDLQIEVLEPLKRVRVTFSGFMVRNDDGAQPEHLQLHFIWTAASRPITYPTEIPTSLLANAISMEAWRDGNWLNLLGNTEKRGYEQFGTIMAEIRGEFYPQERHLRLTSISTRYWGLPTQFYTKSTSNLFITRTDGATFSLNFHQIENGVSNLKYGHLIRPNYDLEIIKRIDCTLTSPFSQLTNVFTIHAQTSSETYKIIVHTKKIVQMSINGNVLLHLGGECEVGAFQGFSLVDSIVYKCENRWQDVDLNRQHVKQVIEEKLVFDLTEEGAKNVKMTGGKGSSLAILMALNSNEFIVPNGFVLSVLAYERFLQENTKVATALDDLQSAFCTLDYNSNDLEELCKSTVKQIQTGEIPLDVQSEIIVNFNMKQTNKRWAIRSSGVDEDTIELSAAGQNATYLACRTIDDIKTAILNCWSSLYTYQSVKYRHGHGLPVKSKMAIVIQEMVDAESAGVLFTCNPSSGSTAEMLLTSNYGLGESVVSGESDPDTFIISRSYTNQLKIKSLTVGKKQTVQRMRSTTGIEGLPNSNPAQSLSNATALKLAAIGVQLAEHFQDGRDVEWALAHAQLYVLQARPVTTLRRWSDHQLLHEHDAATLTPLTCYTLGNTGEVFPGAVTPLTLTTVVRQWERAVQTNFRPRANAFAADALPIFESHVFVDVLSVHRLEGAHARLLDLAVFGHATADARVRRLAALRHGGGGRLAEAGRMARAAWGNAAGVQALKGGVARVQIAFGADDCRQMFDKLSGVLEKVAGLLAAHGRATVVAVLYQVAAAALVGGAEPTPEHNADLALALSNCADVESAEVPRALAELGAAVRGAGVAPEALEGWMREHNVAASGRFEAFVERHGHRGRGEFELGQRPWGGDRLAVARMVCANASGVGRTPKRQTLSVAEIVDRLTTPQTAITRAILRWLVAKCQTAVGYREQSKSEAVKLVHKLRVAYQQLAAKMFEGGLIPHPDLIYFLTHTEVGHIARGRGLAERVRFITRAQRRQRLHKVWSTFEYSEVSFGVPVAKSRVKVRPAAGELVRFAGTAVCVGEVEARACVIRNLDEIDQLVDGDVLVTYSTDIGWSPYFPMLAGIVTELGGLVSHGAVIAREYGLPCLVGVEGASSAFQTGDTVLLSGKNGTIELIKRFDG